jgi:hypothetical protein
MISPETELIINLEMFVLYMLDLSCIDSQPPLFLTEIDELLERYGKIKQ